MITEKLFAMTYQKVLIASVKIPESILFFSFAFFGVSALRLKFIPPQHKLEVLSLLFIVALIIFLYRVFIKKDWSLQSLGFRFDNLKASYGYYLLSAIIGPLVLYWYSWYYGYKHGTAEIEDYFYYSFCGSIAQDFLYRVFLLKWGEKLFGEGTFGIIVSILTFSGMHIIYDRFWENYLWLLMILAGTLFTLLYRKNRKNFLLVTTTHIELNSFSIYLGIF